MNKKILGPNTGLYTNLIVVLAFSMGWQNAWAQQEETVAECDENGVPPVAEPVPLTYGDHTEGCLISPAAETDTFRFEGTAGDVVRINVLGTTGNFGPMLEIRDSANTQLDSGSCSPPFNSICSFSTETTIAANGTYFLSLVDQGSNNEGGYSLQIERVYPQPGVERLNYDSTLDSSDLPVDDFSVTDSIIPATDMDQFFFHGSTGTTVRLNVLGQTGNFGPSIVVRDPTGAKVLDGPVDSAECQPPFNSICSFQVDLSPATTGTYSLAITDRGFNNVGGYQMSLWCVVGDCDNDGGAAPDVRRKMLRYGQSLLAQSINPAVDGDLYRFMGTPGDQVRFSVLGQTGNFAPSIEVRDPAGMVVLDGIDDGAACNPPFNSICSFNVDLMPGTMGQYTMILHDRGINNIGVYQLNLECVFSPVDFTCENLPGRFPADVPEDYWAFTFIETLADYKITVGCDTDKYCPSNPVTRAQMAVFIERGINGGDFQPPPPTGTVFPDVGAGNFAAAFIEQFYRDGITGGCGNSMYCPDDSVTRAQMAVFLLRAKFGADHAPPPPSGIFTDVPVDHWAAAWIEELADENITSGCGEGIYCPEDPVTRDQMAVFILRTFNLDSL